MKRKLLKTDNFSAFVKLYQKAGNLRKKTFAVMSRVFFTHARAHTEMCKKALSRECMLHAVDYQLFMFDNYDYWYTVHTLHSKCACKTLVHILKINLLHFIKITIGMRGTEEEESEYQMKMSNSNKIEWIHESLGTFAVINYIYM